MKLVRTARYARDVRKLKASAEDIEEMERHLAAEPLTGALIQGLRGVRKARIGNRGKSGGGRAIYYLLMADNTVIMITAYAKAQKADLTPEDRKAILRVLEELR
jgi:hypothetical protein